MQTTEKKYRAVLMGASGPIKEVIFSAADDLSADREANDGIDPIKTGQWVATFRIPDDK